MALIFRGASECALCSGVIGTRDDIVATSAFLPREHPLWRYSDAGMHRDCFLTWENRVGFVAAFNSVAGTQVAGNGTCRQMLDDGSIRVVTVDPEKLALAQRELAAMERARIAARAERSRVEERWRNEPRSCPRCGTRFVSVQDKGVCPSCRHVFDASESRGE